jgi:alpha-1,3-rhamnosyl/mannosyltransferase
VLLAAGPPGVGAGDVEAEAERLGVADRVRWAGFVDDTELPVLLHVALALVHPSRAEGFGLTPLEAMAAGAPALVSDVGAVREVTGEAAVLLDPGDPDGWASALRQVLVDPEHRAALVAAGTAHQARFTWRATAEATRAVYDEVLGR